MAGVGHDEPKPVAPHDVGRRGRLARPTYPVVRIWSAMTRVFFVRHGHPSLPVSQTQPDPLLSPLGVAQAQAAGAQLSAMVKRPLLWSSAARRSLQTATVIGDLLEVDVCVDTDLAEIRGAGGADGASRERISRRWCAGDRAVGHPGGETLGAALARFTVVLGRIVDGHPDDDLILVSHGAFVAMGLLHLCEHDWDPMNFAGLGHGAVVELVTHPSSAIALGRVHP